MSSAPAGQDDDGYRADLRRRLTAAVLGVEEGQAVPASLPLDAAITEVAHLLAVLLAQHPELRRPSARNGAIDQIARMLKVEAARLLLEAEQSGRRD